MNARIMKLHLPLLSSLVAVVALSSPTPAFAQAEQAASTETLTIEKLRTPQSPAFVLLGVSPTSVERPMTPKAFAVSLASATEGTTDLIPNSYALEAAPFWLFGHPDLTFEGYYEAGFFQGIAQTLSISFATQRVTSDAMTTMDSGMEDAAAEMTNGSRVSLGARTMLLSGGAHPILSQKVTALGERQGELLDLIEREEDGLITEEEYNQQAEAVGAAMRALALEIQELDHKRVGWQIDLAGAAVWSFPGDTFDGGQVTKWGMWATPSYRFARHEEPFDARAELMAVVRYIDDRPIAQQMADVAAMLRPEEDAFDFGVRGIWNVNNKLSLSFETVRRTIKENAAATGMMEAADSSNRTVGILEYRVGDSSYLFASFGKDFEEAGLPAALASVFGINVGFGDKPVVKFPGQ